MSCLSIYNKRKKEKTSVKSFRNFDVTWRKADGRKERRTDEDELECVCAVDCDGIRFGRDEIDAAGEWDSVVLGT